jgi:hypothetical protein
MSSQRNRSSDPDSNVSSDVRYLKNLIANRIPPHFRDHGLELSTEAFYGEYKATEYPTSEKKLHSDSKGIYHWENTRDSKGKLQDTFKKTYVFYYSIQTV